MFGFDSEGLAWICRGVRQQTPLHYAPEDGSWQIANIGRSISTGVSLFSHRLGEMAHIIQTPDGGQLQCLTIKFALPAGR
jgi:hypothetical protein